MITEFGQLCLRLRAAADLLLKRENYNVFTNTHTLSQTHNPITPKSFLSKKFSSQNFSLTLFSLTLELELNCWDDSCLHLGLLFIGTGQASPCVKAFSYNQQSGHRSLTLIAKFSTCINYGLVVVVYLTNSR